MPSVRFTLDGQPFTFPRTTTEREEAMPHTYDYMVDAPVDPVAPVEQPKWTPASRIPTFMDCSRIVDVESLHSSELRVAHTIEIGYRMSRLGFGELNDDNAAHFFSRCCLLDRIEGTVLRRDTESYRNRNTRMEDVFVRIGMRNTDLSVDATPPAWGRFVHSLIGPRWDSDMRRSFRVYLRDMGGH